MRFSSTSDGSHAESSEDNEEITKKFKIHKRSHEEEMRQRGVNEEEKSKKKQRCDEIEMKSDEHKMRWKYCVIDVWRVFD